MINTTNLSVEARQAHCASTSSTRSNELRGIQAARWGINHMHSNTCSSTSANRLCPTSAEKQRLTSVWGVSSTFTQNDWSGDCIGFAALAWYAAGKKIPLKNARQVFDHYNAAGRITKNTNPPRGALVFWNAWDRAGKNFGHVGVSLGNGRIVNTKGWDGDRSLLQINGISTTNFLGWVMP